jgi:hypothetical protein
MTVRRSLKRCDPPSPAAPHEYCDPVWDIRLHIVTTQGPARTDTPAHTHAHAHTAGESARAIARGRAIA